MLVARGTPQCPYPTALTDVLDHSRTGGLGWQSRMNVALRAWRCADDINPDAAQVRVAEIGFCRFAPPSAAPLPREEERGGFMSPSTPYPSSLASTSEFDRSAALARAPNGRRHRSSDCTDPDGNSTARSVVSRLVQGSSLCTRRSTGSFSASWFRRCSPRCGVCRELAKDRRTVAARLSVGTPRCSLFQAGSRWWRRGLSMPNPAKTTSP